MEMTCAYIYIWIMKILIHYFIVIRIMFEYNGRIVIKESNNWINRIKKLTFLYIDIFILINCISVSFYISYSQTFFFIHITNEYQMTKR